jgi:hypothetical protein
MDFKPDKNGVFPLHPGISTLPKSVFIKELSSGANEDLIQSLYPELGGQTKDKVENRADNILAYYKNKEVLPDVWTDDMYARILNSERTYELIDRDPGFAGLLCHGSYSQLNTGTIRATKFEVEAKGLTAVTDNAITKLFLDNLIDRIGYAVSVELNRPDREEIRHDISSQAGPEQMSDDPRYLRVMMDYCENGGNPRDFTNEPKTGIGFRTSPNKPFKERPSTVVDIGSQRLKNETTKDPDPEIAGTRKRTVQNVQRCLQLDLVAFIKVVMNAIERDPVLHGLFGTRLDELEKKFTGTVTLLADVNNFENDQSRKDHYYVIDRICGERGLQAFEDIITSTVYAFDKVIVNNADGTQSYQNRWMKVERKDPMLRDLFTQLASGGFFTSLINKCLGGTVSSVGFIWTQGYTGEEGVKRFWKEAWDTSTWPGLPACNIGDDQAFGCVDTTQREVLIRVLDGDDQLPKFFDFEFPPIGEGAIAGLGVIAEVSTGITLRMTMSPVNFVMNAVFYEFGYKTRARDTYAIGPLVRTKLYVESIAAYDPAYAEYLKSYIFDEIYAGAVDFGRYETLAAGQLKAVDAEATTVREKLLFLALSIGEHDPDVFKYKRSFAEVPAEYQHIVEQVAPAFKSDWAYGFVAANCPMISSNTKMAAQAAGD